MNHFYSEDGALLINGYFGVAVIVGADVIAIACIIAFYWKVFVALRSSVAQDMARSKTESRSTAKKRILQRAFGALSVLYVVCYVPRIIASAIDYYFEFFRDIKDIDCEYHQKST